MRIAPMPGTFCRMAGSASMPCVSSIMRITNSSPLALSGHTSTAAVRHWGLSQQDYYARADVWPLNAKGEVFVILMMEDTHGIEALPAILQKVPGIGAILIGEGDLSQEL